MNLLCEKPIQCVVAFLFCAFFVSGCSGSGDSNLLEQRNVESAEDINSRGDDMSAELEDDPADASPSEPESDNQNSVVPDPEVQNRTQVDFEITVPVFQSDALQVRLIWGDADITASWIGDEYWSASADLPTNTEHTLSVTFFDDNGGIELASFNAKYKTGVNAAETFQITADQFDSEQWDADEDGVSNFDEFNLGTDPLDANHPTETGNSALQDTLFIPYLGWSAEAAAYYEPEIKLIEFPADIHETQFVDNLPYTSETTVTSIVLTEDGNGTYSQIYDFFVALDTPYNRTSVATRSSQDGAVSWSGTESYTGSSRYYGAVEHVFETVSTSDGSTLFQQGNGTVTLRKGAWRGTANIVRYNYNFVLNLDSMDEENTCSISQGTSYHSFERNIEHEEFSEFTANRQSLEENWAWSSTVNDETSSGDASAVSNRLYCDFLASQIN